VLPHIIDSKIYIQLSNKDAAMHNRQRKAAATMVHVLLREYKRQIQTQKGSIQARKDATIKPYRDKIDTKR
jgi:hypothetical protein